MSRRFLKIIPSVLYFICFAALFVMLCNAFGILSFAHGIKIAAGTAAVVTGYFSAWFSALKTEDAGIRHKIMRNRIFALFLFYIILIVDFTLIDDALGRDLFDVLKWNTAEFYRYINESTNLIPFETLKLFINALKNGTLPFWSVFENIFGNFAAFMPLPFFTVCLFKRINRWYSVLAVTLTSVLLIELLQLLLLTGSSDIDDVILNVSGAMLFYALLRIPAVSRFLTRFTMDVWQ